jgi:hypothetical protein
VPKKAVPLGPGDALFGTVNAPPRFAEADIYPAHERLNPSQQLPDSDLLGALHWYAAEFYQRLDDGIVAPRGRTIDERSLDETALLALGMLVEEAAREALGRRGDLVFTEGEDDRVYGEGDGEDRVRKRRRGRAADGTVGFEEGGFWHPQDRKKKRTKAESLEESNDGGDDDDEDEDEDDEDDEDRAEDDDGQEALPKPPAIPEMKMELDVEGDDISLEADEMDVAEMG